MPKSTWKEYVTARLGTVLVAGAVAAALAGLWSKTRSVDPKEHERVDSALRELRSLDRTINQDVLRARYKMIDGYDPVRRSYRRIEDLEATLASPPAYLDGASRDAFRGAVERYSAAVTEKQRLIEGFKYRSADLNDLLGYLPGAGAGFAAIANEQGDEVLAGRVHGALELALLYSLTSDEQEASALIQAASDVAARGEASPSAAIRRRARGFERRVRALVTLKRAVDKDLRGIFEEPVVAEEEAIARVYYTGYAAAEHVATYYRLGLYAVCLLLAASVALAVRRMRIAARALAVANERLEQRVAERTRELDARNREMHAVLDNVDQALFTVDLEGRLSKERSAMLERWFPEATPGTDLGSVIALSDENTAGLLMLGWDQIRDGFLPRDVAIGQLPRRTTRGGRQYHMSYRPIGPLDHFDKMLLVVSDVTEAVARERRDVEQTERLAIFQRMAQDPEGLAEFFVEGERLVLAVTASTPPLERAVLLRALHTLKGNSAMFGLSSVAALCHHLESELDDSARLLSTEETDRLAASWRSAASKYREMTGGAPRERGVDVTVAEVAALRAALAGGHRPAELLRIVDGWKREAVDRRLDRLAEHAKGLADRLGKGPLEVTCDGAGVRLRAERWAPFWSACVHVVRNAVDHGLESPEDRAAAGKPAGRLALRVREDGDDVVVEISDDGRGVDWEALREKARERGVAAERREDLEAFLLHGGVSTKSGVSEVSGRGVGVGACYEACAELGGCVEIDSEKGAGTTFRFRIPSDDAAAAALTSAA